MLTETETPSITLYYKSGGSDKVYSVAVERSGDGFVVNFAYGRRGSTLNTGTKTASPVDFETARKIYDKLVKEKTAKGYTPGEAGTPYQHTEKADRATGILPQLCNAISESEAERLIIHPQWLAQEKLDGKRILIRRSGTEITGINRKGLVIDLPKPIADFALTLGSQQWLLDGECIGDVFFAFDLLESACVDLRQQTCAARLKALYAMAPAGKALPIRIVETAGTTAAKRALLNRLKKANREGLVFKLADAAHTPGRPASGGDWLKLKFTATASCIVAGVNGSKHSVQLELLDTGRRVGVGNVTIPPGVPIPARGQIVDARYLYAHRGGNLFQPVYLGVRDDIAADACTLGQLKYKAETDEG